MGHCMRISQCCVDILHLAGGVKYGFNMDKFYQPDRRVQSCRVMFTAQIIFVSNLTCCCLSLLASISSLPSTFGMNHRPSTHPASPCTLGLLVSSSTSCITVMYGVVMQLMTMMISSCLPTPLYAPRPLYIDIHTPYPTPRMPNMLNSNLISHQSISHHHCQITSFIERYMPTWVT